MILVAYPGSLVRSLVAARADVVILDAEGLWVPDGAQRRRCDPFEFQPDWAGSPPASEVIARLRFWHPVWSRWVAHADQYELLYREAFLYILHLRAALLDMRVRAAVFHTSVAHHLDSSLVEIACAFAGVPQHFLYRNVITNRLQVLRQLSSIQDRHAVRATISKYDASDDIVRFRERRRKGQPPALNYYSGWRQRSISFAAMDACIVMLRRRVATARRRRADGFLAQFQDLGLSDFIRLLKTQRSGMQYLASRVSPRPLAELAQGLEHPAPVIAAHYQPEATSFPEGGEFDNHIDIVVAIRRLGYTGPIFYKEHTASNDYYAGVIHQTRVGVCRSKSYFERLEALGCIFVDPRAPLSLDAGLNRRIVPVTISGTMTVERSLLGLKTIVAGYAWYRGVPGEVDMKAMKQFSDASIERECSGVAEQALDFLNDMLSGTTLVNAPGIGSGQPLTDAESMRAFATEFESLFGQILAPAA